MKTFIEILNEVFDEENPRFMFQGLSTKLLVQIANGKINAQDFAKYEMVNRGFDKKGKWIGFDDSEKLWFKKNEYEKIQKKYPHS